MKNKLPVEMIDEDRESDGEHDIPADFIKCPCEAELENLPEVVNFIKRLQRFLQRQQSKLSKIRKKLKEQSKPRSVHDVTTQTETANDIGATWGGSMLVEAEQSIAEQVKEVAQNAMQQTGFVYEETSGMYYDYNTGYYYNAELGLYYDGNSGTYYYYDEHSKTFQFHSCVEAQVVPPSRTCISQVSITDQEQEGTCINQVPTDAKQDDEHRNKRKENDKSKGDRTSESKKLKYERTHKPDSKGSGEDSLEEGECSVDSEDDYISSDERTPHEVEIETPNEVEIETPNEVETETPHEVEVRTPHEVEAGTPHEVETEQGPKDWPPCMRIIVQETKLEKLKVGTLFIVTLNGGTMGREEDHAVYIPDINISKHHAKFSYDESLKKYFIVDLGSRNGTLLNAKRLSVAKQESEPHEIVHGSQLQVGGTKLLCHIHEGGETCGYCEPGIVQNKVKALEEEKLETESKKHRHKKELKRIKCKFGLEGASPLTVLPPGYEDRAQIRQATVGSQDGNEKTQQASLEVPIQSDNKGFKLLSKMGWTQGQSLGKHGDGNMEPVPLVSRGDKAGLGSMSFNLPPCDAASEKKKAKWLKAQKRYYQDISANDKCKK